MWSAYCRISSTGGCAPYVSTVGMFTSSTKITTRLPAGAPSCVFFFFSSLVSMAACVSAEAVRAEKFTTMGVTGCPAA